MRAAPISGTVKDPSGAVVVLARIEISGEDGIATPDLKGRAALPVNLAIATQLPATSRRRLKTTAKT